MKKNIKEIDARKDKVLGLYEDGAINKDDPSEYLNIEELSEDGSSAIYIRM